MPSLPDYAVITPARDEAENLLGLEEALAAQTHRPSMWVISENGSADDTLDVATRIAASLPWAKVIQVPGSVRATRGAPIVEALEAGLGELGHPPSIVVAVDADVTFEPDFFARLTAEFAHNPRLGIAGGTVLEKRDGRWASRYVTAGTVFGAVRAYRSECLRDVLPLERRHGWDGIDQLKARSRGWTTRTFLELEVFHHRVEGERERSTWAHWRVNGQTAHFMGYRLHYLALRTLYRMWHDPAALGLLAGFAGSALRGTPRLADPEARAILAADQSVRSLRRRWLEARGRIAPTGASPTSAGRRVPPATSDRLLDGD